MSISRKVVSLKFFWSTMDQLTWEICTKHARELKLASIWATEGSPYFHLSGLSRHNQSSAHKNSYAADEKGELERMATCSSTEIELDCDTPVTMDNSGMLVFCTVVMIYKLLLHDNNTIFIHITLMHQHSRSQVK